ncbi:Methionyl-tRNA formyltransferase, partial [hydrothermal vent metagenome]
MTGDPLGVVFMGTPDFAIPTLKMLIDNDRFNVRAVVTQPDRPKGRGKKLAMSPVKKLALDNEITVFQPEKVREHKAVDTIKSLEPDYLVVVAYGQILPPSLLAIPRLAPVNLHASLLPKYRGAAPIHRAFVDGET